MNPDEQLEAPDIDEFLDSLDEGEAQTQDESQTQEEAQAQEPAGNVQADPPPEPPSSSPPESPPPSEDARIAEGLKALMARERELQEERRKLEEERSKLEPLKKYERIEQLLHEQDAEAALEELGVKVEDLNRAILEGRGVSPHRRVKSELQAKLDEINKQIDERVKRVEEMEVQRLYQETLSEIKANLTPETFPLAAAVGDVAIEAVLSKAQLHYQQNNRVPDYSSVIGEVEKELGDFVDKLLKSDAVRARYLNQETTPPSSEAKSSPTLTNDIASEVSKRKPPEQEFDLSMFDDREDALEALLSNA